jgi:ribosome maturation factor RimP
VPTFFVYRRAIRFHAGEASVVEQVRTARRRVAAGYGLEIFDVQFRREAPGMVLRVQIDRPGPRNGRRLRRACETAPGSAAI